MIDTLNAYKDRLHPIYQEIHDARMAAHAKHGDNSIEAVPYGDSRWLPILVEEVGEVAHEQTYDQQQLYDVNSGQPLSPSENEKRKRQRLRKELIQVAAVATAWAAAIDKA